MQPSKSDFVLVYSTSKASEVVLIKSLLDAADITYFIANENARRLYAPIDLMDIMVEHRKVEEVKELLKDFIKPDKTEEQ